MNGSEKLCGLVKFLKTISFFKNVLSTAFYFVFLGYNKFKALECSSKPIRAVTLCDIRALGCQLLYNGYKLWSQSQSKKHFGDCKKNITSFAFVLYDLDTAGLDVAYLRSPFMHC